MLFNAGAHLTIQDKNGQTAEQLANTPEMRDLIKHTHAQRKIQSDWNSIEKSSVAIIDASYKN
jgi:sensor histidine kinase regulating citrate/malate metabolism